MLHIPSSKELLDLLSDLHPAAAYSLVLGILLLCGFGLPLPEDITLLVAGILASMQKMSFTGALIVSFVGVFVGDSTLFFLGRRFGRKLFKFWPFSLFFTQSRIEAAEQTILKHQHFICFLGRFVPGLRACIFALVGTMGVSPRVFLIQDGLAALVSVPVWVSLGYYTGENWDLAVQRAHDAQWILLGVLVLGLGSYFLYRFIKK